MKSQGHNSDLQINRHEGALIRDIIPIVEVKGPQSGIELRLMQVNGSQINGSEGVSIRDNSD